MIVDTQLGALFACFFGSEIQKAILFEPGPVIPNTSFIHCYGPRRARDRAPRLSCGPLFMS